MEITLTTKTTYDLSCSTDFTNFRNNVNRMLREGQRDDELRHILKQLKKSSSRDKRVGDIQSKITTYLEEKLQQDIESDTASNDELHLDNTADTNKQWQKTGEHSFQRMYVRLIEDAKHFQGDLNFMVAYSAHIINMFMHMATVTPYQHHAASQDREYNSGYCLQYGRSQGKHPQAKLYRNLGGFDKKNRLPMSTAYYKMLKDIDPEGFSQVRQFDPKTGEPNKGANPSGFANLAIAHSGLRRNNLSILMNGLALASRQKKKPQKFLFEKLTAVLPPSKNAFKKGFDTFLMLQEYRAQFEKMNVLPQERAIGSQMMAYRLRRVGRLERKVERLKLQKISVRQKQKNTTCLYVRFYPEFKDTSAAIKEGVTNALIAVFSGILQFKLKQKNICLRAERRQSFGFIRPTLTDAGVLTMRLSLGLEPGVFDKVVVASLLELDDVLTGFDFEQQTSSVVKKVLAIKNYDANKKGQHTYIQSAVNSDRKMLSTFNQAQAYIEKYGSQSIKSGVEKFFKEYIFAEKKLPLTEHTYEEAVVDTKPKEILALLTNTVFYARKMAVELKLEEDLSFSHSFLHAYKKLFKNVNEAVELLNQQDQYSGDILFYQAVRYIENIIEYSLIINAFNCSILMQKKPVYDPVRILRETELGYCRHHLGINAKHVSLFFTDSGQQAINLPMLVYGHRYKRQVKDKACIHLFNETYFEISAFFDDMKKDNVPTLTHAKSKARVLVIDVSQIEYLKLEAFPKLAVCIIDLTHQPDVNNPDLKNTVEKLMQSGITTILSSSTLKHEQLGQDKYQSGKFFLIAPNDEDLAPTKELMDEFQSVSDEAMNPYLASALNLFNLIANVKTQTADSPLRKLSLFSGNKEIENENKLVLSSKYVSRSSK